MKRKIWDAEYSYKKSRPHVLRNELLVEFEKWCHEKEILISTDVKFDSCCIAGNFFEFLKEIYIINDSDESNFDLKLVLKT